MEVNNLFSAAQHGFVTGKSCSTQLLELMEELIEALDSNEDVDIIYLDFAKAIDKVPHKRLLKKLWGYGIRGKVNSWIKEFLTDRSQKVVIEGKSSDSANISSGIPQGSALGPILFLIFINDLPDVILSFINRVGTSIVQPVNSCGKCRIMPAPQILQKSLKWQILALMNKIKLKHPKKFAFSSRTPLVIILKLRAYQYTGKKKKMIKNFHIWASLKKM